MSENPQHSEPETPHDDEIDVEGPNEGEPGHNPPDDGDESSDD